MGDEFDMRGGLVFSGLLHTLAIALFVFGLPDFLRHEPLPDQPIAVQLVNPAEFTRAIRRNKHPVEQAKVETPPSDNPSPKPKPPKPAPAPVPTPPPSAQASEDTPKPDTKPEPAPPPPPPPPQPAPPKPEPKPLPKPEPPKPQPKQLAQAPIPKPKPAKQKKAHTDASFDALLKNLSQKAATLEKQDQPPKPRKDEDEPADEASAAPDAPLGEQLTTAQIDTIRQQFERCWNVPAGARDAKDLQVEIHVDVNPDGTVDSARLVDDQGRSGSDPFWRAAAESALRAVRNPDCSKLNVPLDKYDQWKSLDLFFDPKDLL